MIAIDLSGKSAVVTGGSSGIGAAIARTLRDAGARVTVLARQRAHGGDEEAALYDDGRIAFRALDVADSDAVTRVYAEVAAESGLDIAVHSAGVAAQGTLLETDDAAWRRVMQVNVDGLFFCTREAVRHMMAQGRGGKVVSIGSISGFVGNPGFNAYCTSKGAVVNFTRQAGVDYAQHRININSVAPGFVYTPMTDIYDQGIKDHLAALTPSKTWAQPQHIADATLFLCSGLADHIHGQNLAVDGGWTSGNLLNP